MYVQNFIVDDTKFSRLNFHSRGYVVTKPAAFVHTRRVLDRWHAFSPIGIVHTFTARNGGGEHVEQ
jgi:hypothetical protein